MEFEPALRDRQRWYVGDCCPMAQTLDLLSTKTTFLMIRECFYGTTRFDEFMEMTGMSAPAVSRALKQLEEAGIISRAPYQEPGKRTHDEYHLTPAGEDLLPAFIALTHWGAKHLQDGQWPLRLVAKDSGRPISVAVTDDPEPPSVHSRDIEIQLRRSRRRKR